MCPLILMNQQGQACMGWTLIAKLKLALGLFLEKLKNFLLLTVTNKKLYVYLLSSLWSVHVADW